MTLDTQGGGPSLVDRVKNILIQPKAEWERIDAEPTSIGDIFRGYVLILAAIPTLATLVGSLVFGHRILGFVYRPGIGEALFSAILQYILAVAGIAVLSLIIDALAPTFGGTRSRIQATKVAAYSVTAMWVAGIFGLLPQLAMLASLVGLLYSLYLLYLGLPRLMKVAADKAVAYTAVVVVAVIVVGVVIVMLTAAITSTFLNVRPPLGELSGTVEAPGVGSLDLAKIEAAGKKMEAVAKRMETAASKPALAPAALQALLPANLGAFRRVEISSSGASAAGVGGSQAEARYENGDSNIALKVSDIAVMGGLGAMASALDVQSNRQTETGYEKTVTVNGRMTSESWDNRSQRGSYSILVGNRFMVEASGKVEDIGVLRQAVTSVGLARLESLAA